MHATHILYAAAKPLPVPATARGVCRICGDVDTTGADFTRWVPDTFTNHDQLRHGDIERVEQLADPNDASGETIWRFE